MDLRLRAVVHGVSEWLLIDRLNSPGAAVLMMISLVSNLAGMHLDCSDPTDSFTDHAYHHWLANSAATSRLITLV